METTTKEKSIKKILFYVSLIPYAVLLIWGIINCVIYSIKEHELDLYIIIEPALNFWLEAIVEVNILYIGIIVFALGYPIFYWLDKGDKKKEVPAEAHKETKAGILFVLYVISFVPYLFLVWFGIFGIEFGFFSDYSMYYGFEAIALVFALGSIIAVYPVCIIFQLVYTIKKYRSFSNGQKKLIKRIVIILVLLLVIPAMIHLIFQKHELQITLEEDRKVIEEYLQQEFGEEYSKDMVIRENTRLFHYYYIETPILEDTFEVELDDDRQQIISNDFKERFIEDRGLAEKIVERLTKEYNIPGYVRVYIDIRNVDLDAEKYAEDYPIESLLDACEFTLKSIEIDVDSLERQDVIDTITWFYKEYKELFERHYDRNRAVFSLKKRGEGFYRVDILRPTTEENILTIIFWSTDNEEVYVDLNE